MSLDTQQQPATLPSPLAQERHPVSLRSTVLGLVGVIAISALTPFNNLVLANTDLVGNFLPIGVLLFLMLFVIVVNAPLARFAPRHAFSAGELAVVLGMMLVGWVDDKYELAPRAKFAGQCLIAALVAASGVRITLFVPSLLFSYAITVFWILTIINAFNFMDNMNGLCTGLGAIGTWYFAILAAADGQYLVALIAFLACGALLGFLPYNFPSARAFLGDAGSHLVGYLLAVLAILPHFYTPHHPRRWAVLIPLLVLAVPLLDMAWVVVLRWRLGQPFYVGDNNHLSHRLVRLGFSRTRAVLLIWLLAALSGALVLFC
ncbi:MAG TPA: MraY family glycosyltransferase [Bacillota bacterium]|nr:MraY family glycosyltransferase [Bacillota bacterium]